MIKKRQHYVWQHYLKTWTTKDKLWCRRGVSVFCMGTKNIALERYFYRLKEMSPADLAFVKAQVIDQQPPLVREMCEGWVQAFTEIFQYKQAFQKSGSKDEELAAKIDTSINNLEEDLHAHVERLALGHLDCLRAADISFLRDGDSFAEFCFYVAMQYMRTPTRKQLMATNLESAPFNFEASWGFLRTVLATVLGFNFNRGQDSVRLTFLESGDAGVRFITGDQPVLNTKAVNLTKGEQADELELHYPLGPNLAVQIDFKGSGGPTKVVRAASADEVAALNAMIVAEATGQLYAAEADDLK